MKNRQNWVIIGVMLALTVILWGGFGWGQPDVRVIHPEPETSRTTTSTGSVYSLATVSRAVDSSPDLKGAVLAGSSPMDGGAVDMAKMPIVPGLRATRTRNAQGTLGMSTMMTPQGVDVAGHYLISSAYDHGEQYNSTLYIQDIRTNKLVKTVVLQGRPHVGGITYDADHQQLFVCGEYQGTAEIIGIKLKRLLAYDDKRARPIKYDSRTSLGTQSRASFITYHSGILFVGFFNPKSSGYMQHYDVNKKGQIVGAGPLQQLQNQVSVVSTALFKQHTLSKVQGAVFYGGYAFLSQSFGPGPSKLYVFKENLLKESFSERDAVLVLKMPSHLEQISTYQGRMYLIFESSAAAYRKTSQDHVDRILSLDLATLVKEVRHAK